MGLEDFWVEYKPLIKAALNPIALPKRYPGKPSLKKVMNKTAKVCEIMAPTIVVTDQAFVFRFHFRIFFT